MRDVVLDAGALIALERGDKVLRSLVAFAVQGDLVLLTSAAAVAQVWRGGARQARLARLLNSDLVIELPLDAQSSRRVGALAAAVGATDVVDGHVASIALERDARVATSDPDDLAAWGVAPSRVVRC